jgi:hypothetical protein
MASCDLAPKLNPRGEGAEAIVPSLTIDEAMAPEADTADLLHLDIEGWEGPALLGARCTIAQSREIRLIVEWSFKAIDDEDLREKFRQAAEMLVREGFRFYRIVPPNGNVYTEPPVLHRVAAGDLLDLDHCDLFLTRA